MSFNVICTGCGAPSGPSVGICPFCKTLMTSANGKNSEQMNSIVQLYEKGRLELALTLAQKLYRDDPETSKTDVGFLLLYAKLMIDSEGPTTSIKSVLAEAHLADPKNSDVLDYIELMEIKTQLKVGINTLAEAQLRSVLRRSSNNIHAHFLLGTYLFWVADQPLPAIPHLETCARLSPNFLRAWGCLGAIYRKLGNSQLASRAFEKCVELESEPGMRNHFLKQIEAMK